MKQIRLALLAAFLPALAAAQDLTLAPSPALACLGPADAVANGPDYPFLPLKRDLPGRVKIELEFAGPELRPAVKVLSTQGADEATQEFVSAVRAHVRQFRVPCMRPDDGPVRLVQEYVFEPDKRRVLWSAPVDVQDADRGRQLSCVRHESGSKSPQYPSTARWRDLQGRVLARLRFVAPDQPPQAELFSRASAEPLRKEVEYWAKGLRMPCHAGTPVTGHWTFVFVMAGDAYGFKPITLRQLLGSVKGIERQALEIDTTTMNCPFELRFTYQQPFLRNRVGEIAPDPGKEALAVEMTGPDPSRQPLLDWLSRVEIEAPGRTLDSIFGDTAQVSVPCIKIKLKPKE